MVLNILGKYSCCGQYFLVNIHVVVNIHGQYSWSIFIDYCYYQDNCWNYFTRDIAAEEAAIGSDYNCNRRKKFIAS